MQGRVASGGPPRRLPSHSLVRLRARAVAPAGSSLVRGSRAGRAHKLRCTLLLFRVLPSSSERSGFQVSLSTRGVTSPPQNHYPGSRAGPAESIRPSHSKRPSIMSSSLRRRRFGPAASGAPVAGGKGGVLSFSPRRSARRPAAVRLGLGARVAAALYLPPPPPRRRGPSRRRRRRPPPPPPPA
jgi:hypothetical protein